MAGGQGGYDISGATSSTDTLATSATSGVAGGFNFKGGNLNKGPSAVVILGGLAAFVLLVYLFTGRAK